MLKAYRLQDNRLVSLKPDPEGLWLTQAQWLDLVTPKTAELAQAQALCKLPLPKMRELNELEASSQHLVTDQGFQLNSLFFHRPDGEPRNTNAAFVFDGERLVTLCSQDLPHLRLLRRRNKLGIKPLTEPLDILLVLQESKVEGLADETEQAYYTLTEIQKEVLGHRSADLQDAVDGLAEQEDLIGKIRLCLMDGQRDLRFLIRLPLMPKKYRKLGAELLQDIDSLIPHTDFLSEKADFLLNAALGFINIEQNRLLKIFSIAALVFLPPTLIAGIYGMNFEKMPELSWPWGYPLALGLIISAAVIPLLYVKRKGWM
jgi:magnesium transporter